MPIYSHPFECSECANHAPDDFYRFPEVDDWLIAFPSQHLAHVHFGAATSDENQHTKETQWVLDCCNKIFSQEPNRHYYVIVDMTRSDDSEYPSRESLRLYKEILALPQIDKITFYGVATGMIFFLQLLVKFASKNITVTRTKEEADTLYKTWLQNKQ